MVLITEQDIAATSYFKVVLEINPSVTPKACLVEAERFNGLAENIKQARESIQDASALMERLAVVQNGNAEIWKVIKHKIRDFVSTSDGKIAPEVYEKALNYGLKICLAHWSLRVASEATYNKLKEELIKSTQGRGLYPLVEVKPSVISNVVRDFVNLFEQASEHERFALVRESLLPNHPISYARDHSTPLFYIMATSNYSALEKIRPYLPKDIFSSESYGSVFAQYILLGLQRGFSREPLECMNFLLREDANLFKGSGGKVIRETLQKVVESISGESIEGKILLRHAKQLEDLLTPLS
jgi:hypothetical protein